jgi:uncharacterized protein YjbJ (UPF0337 family)
MNTLAMKGNWNVTEGRVKQTLARLADDDLQLADGIEVELTGRIQKNAATRRKNLKRVHGNRSQTSGQLF